MEDLLVEALNRFESAIKENTNELREMKASLASMTNNTHDTALMLRQQATTTNNQKTDNELSIEEKIKKIKINKSWTEHVKVANEATNLSDANDRLTLGELLRDEDNEPIVLAWIVSFLTGTKYAPNEETGPVLKVAKDENYRLVFRNFLTDKKNDDLDRNTVLECITQKMITFAEDKYANQSNLAPRPQEEKKPYKFIQNFNIKYMAKFQEWSKQLLMTQEDRNELQRKQRGRPQGGDNQLSREEEFRRYMARRSQEDEEIRRRFFGERFAPYEQRNDH